MPDGEAGAAVVAVLLLVAITVALAAYVVVADPGGIRQGLENRSNSPPPDTGFFAQHVADYTVRPVGPDDVPLSSSTLIIVADGARYDLPASVLSPQLPAGAAVWGVGQSVCLAGQSAGCLLPAAAEVSFAVRSNGSTIVDLPALPGGAA